MPNWPVAASANARRLLTDAETLLSAGSCPTAYSLAVLAFEEIGKSWLCTNALLAPDSLRAVIPFGELMGRHSNKLQAARMIMPMLALVKGEPDSGAEAFAAVIAPMEDVAQQDNLAKQRGIYVDYDDGAIWNPSQVGCDEARDIVARVRDLLDQSAPLAEPDFLRFALAPLDDARAEMDALVGRFIDRALDDDSAGVMDMLAELRAADPCASGHCKQESTSSCQ